MDTKPLVSSTEMNMLEDEAGQEDIQGVKGVQLKGENLYPASNGTGSERATYTYIHI